MRHGRLVALTIVALLVPAAGASASVPFTTAAARESEPVVLKGAQFGTWSVPANVTAKAPLTDLACHAHSDGQGPAARPPPATPTATRPAATAARTTATPRPRSTRAAHSRAGPRS